MRHKNCPHFESFSRKGEAQNPCPNSVSRGSFWPLSLSSSGGEGRGEEAVNAAHSYHCRKAHSTFDSLASACPPARTLSWPRVRRQPRRPRDGDFLQRQHWGTERRHA